MNKLQNTGNGSISMPNNSGANKSNIQSNAQTNKNMSNVKSNTKTNLNMNRTIKSNNKPSSPLIITGYSTSNIFGIILLVVVIIVIIAGCYWAYNAYTSKLFETSIDVVALADVKNASTQFAIGSGSIPNSSYSNAYSISMWLNISDFAYNYGKEKTILSRGDNLSIVLGDKTNDLIVRLKLQGPVKSPSTISGSASASGSGSASASASGSASASASVSKFVNVLNHSFNNDSNQLMQSIKAMESPQELQSQQSHELQDSAQYYDSRISNNSTPLESQVIDNGFFALISGNNIDPSPTASMHENFDNTTDLVNATVAVLTDLCKLTTLLQSQTAADDQVNTVNTGFQQIIDALEQTRTTAKTSSDVATVFNKAISQLPTLLSPTANVNKYITQLQTDLTALHTLSSNNSTITLSSIQTTVNSKLASLNCPFTLSGTTDIDVNVNFYESFINTTKQAINKYINNMSYGSQQSIPKLQNVNCLIDSVSNQDPTIGTCIYKMIPLQKWVNVNISVNNQIVDIYIDGQLGSSCVLKGFPAISTTDVNLTPNGGFSGQISKVIFSNTAMTSTKARELYYAGPIVSSSLFSSIPSWVWYIIIFLIAGAILYSVLK